MPEQLRKFLAGFQDEKRATLRCGKSSKKTFTKADKPLGIKQFYVHKR